MPAASARAAPALRLARGCASPPISARFRRDRGAVTVEGAIVLCSLVLIFGMVLTGLAAVTDQLRCADAARVAARLAARGERQLAGRTARTLAPSGASVDLRVAGQRVAVTVRAEPVGGLLPGLAVRAEAHAELEPGVGEGGRDPG
jgi:Flp pilus assembly protein TadG